ncbi:MAG: nuclear transport factor 2 family protein [Planctomycetales bacterium]|nr:nuclear transport factor 2 family protein [Planctomycetales bacterium]
MKATFLLGSALRDLRTSRSLTQTELAKIAGVSERTVRNAEGERPIRRDFAEFIARALDVNLACLERTSFDLNSQLLLSTPMEIWQLNAQRILHHIDLFVRTGQYDEFMNMLHPAVQLRSFGTPTTSYNGTYVGHDGIHEYFRRSNEMMTQRVRSKLEFDRILGEGNIVVLSGVDTFDVASGGETMPYWFTWIFTFQGERIIDMVQTIGLSGVADRWSCLD